jgi:ABC-type methionine transport system ATPase subunit
MPAAVPAPVLELVDITKQYQGLRPLRIQKLVLGEGERIAVSGLDAQAAEVFVVLVTGATLPDSGDVRVAGRSTRELTGEDEWLAWLDRFGVVSHRAVLLEGSTVAQNLALAFTLEIDPMSEEVRARVHDLASEVDLTQVLDVRAGQIPASSRISIQLGRALALNPDLLLLEHPTAAFGSGETAPFGRTVARVARRRGLPVLAISEDNSFSRAAADRRLRLDLATGALRSASRWF